MKIEASKRLTAVKLDLDSFTDAQGEAVMKEYNPRGIGFTVKTSIKGVTLSISRDSFGKKLIRVYVLADGEPVGIVAFEQIWTKCFQPHSWFKKAYRGKGYASAVYKWVLNSSVAIVSDQTQSPAARALWKSLAKEYTVVLVNPYTNYFYYSGNEAFDHADEPRTVLVLLNKGITADQFKRDFDFKEE